MCTVHTRRRRAGFSLLELCLGIAVLLILAALAFPVIRSYRNEFGAIGCMNGMRQVGSAFFAYQAEHNGYFPPGKPAHPKTTGAIHPFIVPQYIPRLPICPNADKDLTPEERQIYGNTENYFNSVGGTYGINYLLLQRKPVSLPDSHRHIQSYSNYSPSRMVFILETGVGAATWSFTHQRQALGGVSAYKTKGRHHGGVDRLNFMFLDGHIELLGSNDARDVPEDQKAWVYPTNPDGLFHVRGEQGRYIPHSELNADQFEKEYPDP